MNIKSITRIFEDESGATAIEYGLIAGLVAVAAISSMSAVGQALDGIFSQSAKTLTSAISGGGGGEGGGGAGGV